MDAMSSEEFREEIRNVIRRHDPSSDELLKLSDDLKELAERYERQDKIL